MPCVSLCYVGFMCLQKAFLGNGSACLLSFCRLSVADGRGTLGRTETTCSRGCCPWFLCTIHDQSPAPKDVGHRRVTCGECVLTLPCLGRPLQHQPFLRAPHSRPEKRQGRKTAFVGFWNSDALLISQPKKKKNVRVKIDYSPSWVRRLRIVPT